MIRNSTRHKFPQQSQGGFSLVEVLIGLILSGLLMSMVAMVLGQSITNNEVVRSSAGLSSRMFTLRRVLHRDFQNIVSGTLLGVEEQGFSIATKNNYLLDGGVKVSAVWDFSGNMVRRYEESVDLGYSGSHMLIRGLSSWRLELLDGDKDVWLTAQQFKLRGYSPNSVVKALRLNLSFEDGNNVLIVERVPYVSD